MGLPVQTRENDDYKLIRFSPTKPLSTYLALWQLALITVSATLGLPACTMSRARLLRQMLAP